MFDLKKRNTITSMYSEGIEYFKDEDNEKRETVCFKAGMNIYGEIVVVAFSDDDVETQIETNVYILSSSENFAKFLNKDIEWKTFINNSNARYLVKQDINFEYFEVIKELSAEEAISETSEDFDTFNLVCNPVPNYGAYSRMEDV